MCHTVRSEMWKARTTNSKVCKNQADKPKIWSWLRLESDSVVETLVHWRTCALLEVYTWARQQNTAACQLQPIDCQITTADPDPYGLMSWDRHPRMDFRGSCTSSICPWVYMCISVESTVFTRFHKDPWSSSNRWWVLESIISYHAVTITFLFSIKLSQNISIVLYNCRTSL